MHSKLLAKLLRLLHIPGEEDESDSTVEPEEIPDSPLTALSDLQSDETLPSDFYMSDDEASFGAQSDYDSDYYDAPVNGFSGNYTWVRLSDSIVFASFTCKYPTRK